MYGCEGVDVCMGVKVCTCGGFTRQPYTHTLTSPGPCRPRGRADKIIAIVAIMGR